MQIILDVYGTLLDIGSPVAALAERVGPNAAHLNDLWRAKQLEYAWVATLTGGYAPFWEMTERALVSAMSMVGLSGDAALKNDLLGAYRTPSAYPEVAAALQRCSALGHRLSAFSNADTDMLHQSLSAAGLVEDLDDVVSIDAVKVFKPHRDAYAYAQKVLACGQSECFFLSSNGWDVTGARSFGWTALWINRMGRQFEFLPTRDMIVLSDLSQLADYLGRFNK